jgi:hypothetical protein
MLSVQAFMPLLLATFEPVVSGAPFCVPGFCPTGVTSGPPSGVMFLAVGLVVVGLRGLLRGRPGRG